MPYMNAFILADAATNITPPSTVDMVIKSVLFLLFLALGGYFFVLFHRKGYFKMTNEPSSKRLHENDIKIVAMRVISGKRCLISVEHFGKRILILSHPTQSIKLSEWTLEDITPPSTTPSEH